MAETQKEDTRIIAFLASSIHRKDRLGKLVEKGGGDDGSYTTSKVELLIPEVLSPFVVVYDDLKPTVIASVNAKDARSHNKDEETLYIISC